MLITLSPQLLLLLPLLLLSWQCSQVAAIVESHCPNSCSHNGVCSPGPQGSCRCFPGFAGVDCSLRTCPSAPAWVDFPTANDTAHARNTECSNKGICDRTTGLCTCYKGFTGAACEQTLCPLGLNVETNRTNTPTFSVCSGRGRCISLRQASIYQDFVDYLGSEEYDDWDADRVFGCVCEEGYEGPSCSRKSCPKGDDPATPSLPGIALIDCQCLTCAGTVQLSSRGQVTAAIPYDAATVLVQHHLRRLKGLEAVTVSALRGSELCSSGGSVFAVTFPQSADVSLHATHSAPLVPAFFGSRLGGFVSRLDPQLKSRAASGLEHVECNAHGVCDYGAGQCRCFSGFASSDGLGAAGGRGDCGHVVNASQEVTTPSNVTVSTPCAVRDGQICSGHGHCLSEERRCLCDDGYDGFDCSRKACPPVRMWFGVVGEQHRRTAACAGVGLCNVTTGQCTDCGVFSGPHCQVLPCPVDRAQQVCGGRGACLSLRDLAAVGYGPDKQLRRGVHYTAWDADMIEGCACARSPTVDGRLPLAYSFASFLYATEYSASADFVNVSRQLVTDDDRTRFYRGPYAQAVTDFAGYDCSLMACPAGDDPRTHGVNEIQAIACSASSAAMSGNGFAQLVFRENGTVPLYLNASLEAVQTALEDVFTVSRVKVWASEDWDQGLQGVNSQPAATLCTPSANITLFVEFVTEHGPLPLLQASGWTPDNSLDIRVTRVQTGTKEDIECSGAGICDSSTGRCKCLRGFMSSDGTTDSAGERGDCGYYNLQHFVTHEGS